MISIFLAGLPLALLAPQGGEAESLRFDVRPGTVLRRELVVRHEIQLDGVTNTRGNEALTRQDVSGWMSTWLKVAVDDTVGEVADGRPLALRRRWVDLGGTGTLTLNPAQGRPKFEDRAVLSSPLRDRQVDFTWIEAEGDWARLWVRDDAEEFWLAEMRGDMDGLGLIPADPVAPGAEWDVPIEGLRGLLAPGGNHLITPRTTNLFGRNIEVGVGGDYSEVLGPALAGVARARFEGVREEGGERLAVLRLTVQTLSSIADRTDLWRLSAPPEERNEVSHLRGALLEYELEAQGEVLWNLDRGHLHAARLSGDERYMISVNKQSGPVAEPFEISQQSSFRGRVELTYTVGPPPPEEESAGAARDH
ncbi:MAG TPA: hypothetical protein VMT18_15385 [Planctomycetota bacterium]|nr:hypothetical protein [Planctomycetota bacterium]